MGDNPSRWEVMEFVDHYIAQDLIIHTSLDTQLVDEAKRWIDNHGKPLLTKFRMMGVYDDVIEPLRHE